MAPRLMNPRFAISLVIQRGCFASPVLLGTAFDYIGSRPPEGRARDTAPARRSLRQISGAASLGYIPGRMATAQKPQETAQGSSSLASLGLTLSDWFERWFPDAFALALAAA